MNKKKILSILLVSTMAATALAGCGKKDSADKSNEELKEGVEYVITTDNVKVAQYKGLSINGYDTDISDEEIDEFIDSVMQYVYAPSAAQQEADSTEEATDATDEENTEATEDAAEDTAEDTAEAGEVTADVPALTHEDLTDDIVVEVSDGQYNNVADYREYVRGVILEQNESYFVDSAKKELFQRVVDDSVLLEYSDEDLQSYIDYANEYYAEYAEYLGTDIETFYKDNMGFETEDEFNDFINDEALANLKTEYVIKAIADAEGIEVTEEDIDANVQQYITDGYFSTEDEVLDYITRDEISVNLKYNQILDIIYDAAEILPYVEDASSDVPTEVPEEAETGAETEAVEEQTNTENETAEAEESTDAE